MPFHGHGPRFKRNRSTPALTPGPTRYDPRTAQARTGTNSSSGQWARSATLGLTGPQLEPLAGRSRSPGPAAYDTVKTWATETSRSDPGIGFSFATVPSKLPEKSQPLLAHATKPAIPPQKRFPPESGLPSAHCDGAPQVKLLGVKDSVCGPGEYDPQLEPQRSTDFNASQSTRDIFKPSASIVQVAQMAPDYFPGPGAYNVARDYASESFTQSVGAPAFGASEKLQWQRPRKASRGAEFYDTDVTQASGLRGRAYAKNTMSFKKALGRYHPVPMLPHTKPDNRVPGPGAYEVDRKPVKRPEPRKGRPELEQPSERSTTAPSTMTPGPDEYQGDQMWNFSMSSMSERNSRRFRDHAKGGFGSDSERFGKSRRGLDPYDIEEASRARSVTRMNISCGSSFRSLSARLPSHETFGPGPGTYASESTRSRREAKTEHLSFGSCRNRFGNEVFPGVPLSAAKTPAPGEYDIAKSRGPGVWGLNAKAKQRPDPGEGQRPNLGPGSYETSGPLGKKTHNVRLNDRFTPTSTSVY